MCVVKKLIRRKKWWFIAGIFILLMLSGVFLFYRVIDSPAMQTRRYAKLKQRYPVFNDYKAELVSYADPPEGEYLKFACKTSDIAVFARVTRGNEKAAKSDVVNRMRTSPFVTEDDYSLEDITEFLRQDPNRLHWGNNCHEYEIEIEKVLYSKVDKIDSNNNKMSVRIPYSNGYSSYDFNELFRAYTGMEVVFFLTEKKIDDQIHYEINQDYPFYISEDGYVVPASTLYFGHEEYGGMRIGKFVREVKRAYKMISE